MDINQFLNLVEETIEDSLDHINKQILAKYGKDIEAESNEEDEVCIKYPIMRTSCFIQALSL